jgi:hypothetical protein
LENIALYRGVSIRTSFSSGGFMLATIVSASGAGGTKAVVARVVIDSDTPCFVSSRVPSVPEIFCPFFGTYRYDHAIIIKNDIAKARINLFSIYLTGSIDNYRLSMN